MLLPKSLSAAVWTMHYLDSAKRQLHNFDLSKPLYIITSQKESKEIIPTMPQTLVRFLPMAGSSLWQSVIRFGDGTKLFLTIKHYKSYLLWVIIDFWGYPHPFSFLTVRCCGRFAHLKRGTGEEPVFLIHSDWIPIEIIPYDALGPAHCKYFINFLLIFHWTDCVSIWLI